MPKGRPKKPDAVKKLEGNPGKRPLNEDAPLPEGAAKCPPYVTGYAQEIWNEIINSMPPSLYTAADSIVLGAFCVAVAQHRSATEELAREGLTIVTDMGVMKPHPALTAQSKALSVISLLGSKLGLDPVARASMKVPPAPKAKSKFEGLVNSGIKKIGEDIAIPSELA